MTEEQQESEKKAFNMALALLQRVDSLFYMLEERLIKGEFFGAREILSAILNEIDFCLNDTERKEIEDLEKKIDDVLLKINIDETYNVDVAGIIRSFFRYPQGRLQMKKLLIELNRKLRRCMNNHNLIMPPESESSLF